MRWSIRQLVVLFVATAAITAWLTWPRPVHAEGPAFRALNAEVNDTPFTSPFEFTVLALIAGLPSCDDVDPLVEDCRLSAGENFTAAVFTAALVSPEEELYYVEVTNGKVSALKVTPLEVGVLA